MSELQLDDPDPLPTQRRYPVNFETDLSYEGYDLSRQLLEEEILSRDEREDIVVLSNYASSVLDTYGEGSQTRMHAYTEGAELHRIICDGAWIYTLVDTLEDRRRCRSWRLGGDSVSWCDDEWRYEEASAVGQRLRELFPLATGSSQGVSELGRITQGKLRLKRALANAILR